MDEILTLTHSEQESSESESRSNLKEGTDTGMSPPREKKARKLSGAATYKTKFSATYKKEYPFIISVQGDLRR